MTPKYPNCSRSQVRQIRRFRRDGYTYREIGEAMDMRPERVARYERGLDMWGLSAFASKSPQERARAAMRRGRG